MERKMEEKYCLILGRVPHTWSDVDESANYCDIDKVLRVSKRLGGGSLHDLSKEDLDKVFIGMKGIIKLGHDKRDKDRCNDLIQLKRGIYATFEVICFNFNDEEQQIIYRIKDNFFRENKIISDKEGIKILGKNKFDLSQRSAGVITLQEYKDIMKCYRNKS
jgi:hypothetical protein